MRQYLFIPLYILLFSISSFAQVEEPRIFFRNDKTVGVTAFSNGFGLDYRFGERLDYYNKKLYFVSFSSLRHPKEVKTSNPYYGSSENFIFGKQYSTFRLKALMGRQHEMYTPGEPGTIAVRYFYNYGLSLALLKPIYYEVMTTTNGIDYQIYEAEFDASIHTIADIYGKASYFKGVDELKVIPGLSANVGFSFDFSQQNNLFHAIEAGINLDVYYRDIPIMAVAENSMVFLGVFVTYRFGKIIDAAGIIEND